MQAYSGKWLFECDCLGFISHLVCGSSISFLIKSWFCLLWFKWSLLKFCTQLMGWLILWPSKRSIDLRLFCCISVIGFVCFCGIMLLYQCFAFLFEIGCVFSFNNIFITNKKKKDPGRKNYLELVTSNLILSYMHPLCRRPLIPFNHRATAWKNFRIRIEIIN